MTKGEKNPYSVTWEEIKALLRSNDTQPTARSKLTGEQKKAYLENQANLCPFCKSADIAGGPVEVNGPEAWQEVSCNQCHRHWRDVYTLAFVEDLE